jgi:cytochrome c-type biogenesis protein CcmE
MTHRYIKIGLTVVVLVGSLVAVLWTSMRDGAEFFKHVDEVMVQPDQWEGRSLQLHGYVVPGSIARKPDSLDYRFDVQNNPARAGEPGHVVQAVYTGVVPDTFKGEAEVVMSGTLTEVTDASGQKIKQFHAKSVTAKCPSKYEAQAGGPSAGI